jgi:hypothetical protein
MATYEVKGPDGSVYEVTAPDGASESDVLAYAQKNFKAPSQPKADQTTAGERYAKGLRDPIDGGAQLLTKALPQGVVDAGNRLNNWLADKTGLVGRLPEGGVDQQVREGEAAYQAKRGSEAGSFDGMRLVGNIVNPATLIGAGAGGAATLPGRMAVGSALGVAGGGLAPVTGEGEYWDDKRKQLMSGAVGGAVAPAVIGGLSRVVSPRASTNPQVALLRQEGVRPTIGQTLGGGWSRAEEKLTSLPVVGDAISHARRGAAEDLSHAALNRALAPINQRLPANLTGREAVQHVDDAISRGYNQLLPSLTARADQQFTANIGNLRQMVNTGAMDPNASRTFNRILQNDVLGKFGGQQAMTGETLKRVESDLGVQINRFANSTDADQRLVGDALQSVRDELRQLLTRSNPNQAAELRRLNTAWANFKRPQRAASMLGAEDGIPSPAQLQSAVKALDRSKDKARFAEGRALMQDLSQAGRSVLGNNVPDSGTAGRLFMGGGLSLLDPTLTAPILLGAGAGMYTRPMQGLLAGAVSRRPQFAQPVAEALRQASPGFGLLGGQMGAQLLQ